MNNEATWTQRARARPVYRLIVTGEDDHLKDLEFVIKAASK